MPNQNPKPVNQMTLEELEREWAQLLFFELTPEDRAVMKGLILAKQAQAAKQKRRRYEGGNGGEAKSN